MSQTNLNPNITRSRHSIDASNKTLGKLAVEIADLLRGKRKINFVEHLDVGDFVNVINADKFVLTGNKINSKVYYRHSGYLGNLKIIPVKDLLKRSPNLVIYKAVSGMLPKNRLQNDWLKRLSFNKEITNNEK